MQNPPVSAIGPYSNGNGQSFQDLNPFELKTNGATDLDQGSQELKPEV